MQGCGEVEITELQLDAELASRAAAGDHAAWTEIFRAHHSQIYRYVAARVPQAEAADLTADVFVSAVASIGNYARQGPLLAWLYGIARHRVADYHRRTRRREPFIARLPGFGRFLRNGEEEPDVASPPDTRRGNDPATSIEGIDLERALDRLTDDQREVIVLRHFMGLSTSEIAALLRRQPSAVYSLEARALARLRQELT